MDYRHRKLRSKKKKTHNKTGNKRQRYKRNPRTRLGREGRQRRKRREAEKGGREGRESHTPGQTKGMCQQGTPETSNSH